MTSYLNAKTLTLALAAGTALLAVYSRGTTPDTYNSSKTKVFTDLLGALSVLVFGLTLIGQEDQNERQYYLDMVSYTDKDIQEQWLSPNDLFAEKASVVPELIASLQMNNPVLQTACARSPQACAKAAEEQNICIRILQHIETFLNFRSLDNTGDNTWLSCFLPWCRSPIFQKYFPMLKYAYRDRTAQIVELLIHYANTQPLNNSDDIDRVANLIIADPAYHKALLNTRDTSNSHLLNP